MRNIDHEIFSDEWFGTLDLHQRILWLGILVNCADDQGRLINSPLRIRLKVFPYDTQITVEQIQATLNNFIESQKLLSYKAGLNGARKDCLQVVNWWRYQKTTAWAAPSEHPAPEGWMDRIRCHSVGNVIRLENWDLDGGYLEGTKALPSDSVVTAKPRPLSESEGEGESEVEVEGEVESDVEKPTTDDRLSNHDQKKELCKLGAIPENYARRIIEDDRISAEDLLAEMANNYSKKIEGKVRKPGLITGKNLTANPIEKAENEWYDRSRWSSLPDQIKKNLGIVIQSQDDCLKNSVGVTTRSKDIQKKIDRFFGRGGA